MNRNRELIKRDTFANRLRNGLLHALAEFSSEEIEQGKSDYKRIVLNGITTRDDTQLQNCKENPEK
jgi:hypothetical protein